MFVSVKNIFYWSKRKERAIFHVFLLFFSLKNLKSAGFPHKKFLCSKSNASSSWPRKKFLDPVTPPNMFSDTSSRCKVSSEANGVIIRHIDRSILQETSANTNFSNLVLAQNVDLGRWKPSKRAIFLVLGDFKGS